MQTKPFIPGILLVIYSSTTLLIVYSYDGIGTDSNNSPCRMKKCNELWDKAKRKYDLQSDLMTELYDDLKLHDKQLRKLKRLKEDRGDNWELIEAEMEKTFVGLMRKYKLSDNDDETNYSNIVNRTSRKQSSITNPKLSKLWMKAQSAGFTESELEALKDELSHHQDNLDEYEALKNEINDYYDEPRDNSRVDKTFHTQFIKEREKQLKSSHQMIRANYERLEQLSSADRHRAIPKHFTDPRVRELWFLAQTVNMTDVELSSLKTELEHFNTRIEKHSFFQNELNKVLASDGGDRAAFLNEKLSDYQEQVVKSHETLKRKVADVISQKSEL